jgi:biopolymer transport protein ExbD
MPLVAPGRRIGSAYNSQALKKKQNAGRRSPYAALLLTPMVDMFTILVLYLIQQFNATGQILFIDPDLRLPEAHKAVDVTGNPPLISITNDMISVQGKPVQPTAVLKLEGEWSAPKLEQALRELRQLSTDVAESTGGRVVTESAQGMVMVQADVTVPYILVKKTLFVAAKAGFGRADFAVTRAAQVAAAPP